MKTTAAIGQVNVFEEIIVDNFAGGGGASTGIELATGRVVDIAVNHDPDAILMHKTNHPHTVHYQASVWDIVNPLMMPLTVTNTTNSVGAPASEPVHTVTSAGNQMLVCPSMIQYHTEQAERVRAAAHGNGGGS